MARALVCISLGCQAKSRRAKSREEQAPEKGYRERGRAVPAVSGPPPVDGV